MDISDNLLSLFSATVERRDGSYVVELPANELELGDIEAGETYRIAVLPTRSKSTSESAESTNSTSRGRSRGQPAPPVEEGETRVVEIEDIGEQGDGITRVERGYVVIVPDTEKSERVEIEITDVNDNVAFATVTERISYYD